MTSRCVLLFLLAVSCLLPCALGRGSFHQEKCKVSPAWTASGGEPTEHPRGLMMDHRGEVVLVALVAASSGHSLHQAKKLDLLYSYFHGIDMADLQFFVLNSRESVDHLPRLTNLNLTLTILQETENDTVWNDLGGKKDDIFIYDRCGRLTYYIPFPLSTIHPQQQLVESAVISTYLDDLCGDRWCEDSNASKEQVDMEMLNSTHNLLLDIEQVANVTEQIIFEPESGEDKTNSSTSFQDEISVTVEPTTQPGNLWSTVQRIWSKMPWVSQEDKAKQRMNNSVLKFSSQLAKNTNSTTVTQSHAVNQSANCSVLVPDTSRSADNLVETSPQLCNTTKQICRGWSLKKLEHASLCCNGSAQHTRIHCKHYTKPRCKKVELILKCCHENGTKIGSLNKSNPLKS